MNNSDTMTLPVSDLMYGDYFRRAGNDTIYRCEHIRSENGWSIVTYTFGEYRFVFSTPSLTTVTVLNPDGIEVALIK